MKTLITSLGVFLLFCFITLTNCFADPYVHKLVELVEKYNDKELFSGTVLFANNGVILTEKTAGYADWKNKTPNTAQTVFNIASLTKEFTYVIVKQLDKEGKLSLDDKLSKYVSIYPDDTGNKITIRMLLEMKAGLGDYLNDPEYIKNAKKFRTVNDYLMLIKNEPLLFEPGTSVSYSNSGYAVLGGVIEKATGKSYEINLKERIFDPLEMKNTYYRQIGDNIQNAAVPADISYKGDISNINADISPSPAGGIFSCTGDMYKFDKYLRTSGFMNEEVRAGGAPGWNSIHAQYKGGYTLIILSNFPHFSEEIEKRFSSVLKKEQYAEITPLPEMDYYNVLKEEGTAGLENNFKKILEAHGEKYDDRQLNKFGYQLLKNNDADRALEVFKLNTKLFPQVSNVFDSLGDGYLKKGDKDLAIESYRKALALEPGNKNARNMLDRLQK